MSQTPDKNTPVTASDDAQNIAADVDEVMRKYDRESNTRIWSGWQAVVIKVFMAAFALLCICMTLFSTAMPEIRLPGFMGFIVLAGFLNFPASKHHVKPNYLPWYDILLMVIGAGCFFYFAFNAMTMIKLATRIQPIHVVIGVVGILVLVELCRRCVGLPILVVAGLLIFYAFYNQLSYNPSFYQALKNIIYKLFYTTSGVIGTPISVCYTYIVLFIIFGAFLERTGIANFFISFANRIAGWSSGGPAKVAVISSALCGMVSGSSVGNTVTTGSFTIPMMKKTGYKGEFAGAVEAAASTGGQIMPPIMGAAAFLMVDYVSLPYSNIVARAILPAALYFTGIFICVHLEAKKTGLQGVPRSELPPVLPLLKKSYLLLPLVILVYLVSSGSRTMAFAAAVATLAAIAVSMFAKDTRMTPKRFFEALAAGTQGCISVGVACCVAGIVAGCLTMTGLANQILQAIIGVSGNAKLLALFLTMLCCIVLGMGVPTTANYCIMATTCAPILVQMGIPTVAAHFFVFYFGIVADLTPPVALAAYAGAAIAGANPMKTAFNATKLAIAAFIIPYILAYNPAMVLVDTTVAEVLSIAVTSLVGMFGIGMALEGFYRGSIPWYLRILSAAGGLCLVYPGAVTDVIGVVVVGTIIVLQLLKEKRARKAA